MISVYGSQIIQKYQNKIICFLICLASFYAPAIREMVERAYSVTPVLLFFHPSVHLSPLALAICVKVFQAGASVSFGRISSFLFGKQSYPPCQKV